MKVSSLIFDLDGTLIDSSQDLTSSVNHTLAQLGLPKKSKKEVESFIGDGMKTLLIRATGTKDESVIDKAIEIFRPHYCEHCAEETKLYPGVKVVLDFFKGKKIAVVSNKPLEMCRKILARLKIQSYFSAVLGAESTENKKPHPEPLLKSLELMRVRPAETMMIGDGDTDIDAGKSAGVLTCAVTYGFKDKRLLESRHPDFIIDRPEDLINLVA